MTTTSEQDENLDEGQPLVDHLIELRSRVLRSLVAVFAIFVETGRDKTPQLVENEGYGDKDRKY